MAEKRIGHGAVIKLGGVTLTQIRNITPAAFSREEVATTTLDSTVEETLPSDPENVGEVSFEQIWTQGDTNHELIDTDFDGRVIGTYAIVFPWSTPRTATFSAWVKSKSPARVESKEAMARTVVLKLTSAITWS